MSAAMDDTESYFPQANGTSKATPQASHEGQLPPPGVLDAENNTDAAGGEVPYNGEATRPVTAKSVKFRPASDGISEEAPADKLSTLNSLPDASEGKEGISQDMSASAPNARLLDPHVEALPVHETPLPNIDNLETEADTPPMRRSVQFSRATTAELDRPAEAHSRKQSVDAEDGEGTTKGKQGSSLLSRIKALAAPTPPYTHGRSLSNFTLYGGDSTFEYPTRTSSMPHYANEVNLTRRDSRGEASEGDADGEESQGEEVDARPQAPKKRIRSRRTAERGPPSTPTTPRQSRLPSFLRDSPLGTPATGSGYRPSFLLRRATMTEIPENQRQGVSEDEGRDRLANERVRRKASAWANGARSFNHAFSRQQDGQPSPEEKRPGNLRRFTGFAQGSEGAPSPWRLRGERTSSISAQKWRQLKAGLKMLGHRKKDENRVDHAKSAELLAELLAAAPAALLFASMFQRDEHGHKRIPVLLEQLKLHVVDSQRVESRSGDRHVVFKIELEYGSGLTRMKWVVHRTLRDFTNLHLKYKLQKSTQRYVQLKAEEMSKTKLPRFPKTAFPYLRGVRGLYDEDDEDEDEGTAGEVSGPEADLNAVDRPKKSKKRPPLKLSRRHSSVFGAHEDSMRQDATDGGNVGEGRRETYAERQRKKLEIYLQQMIRYLIFRADSNRLCKFLELSALGVRLASEGGYHGKEGTLMLQSGKGLDYRKALNPSTMTKRHTPKWFLVRHSYVVCVDSPEEMNVYDVFLVDSDFNAESLKKPLREQSGKEMAKTAKASATHPKHHLLRLHNSERKLKLLAKNDRMLSQFEESIRFMTSNTDWSKKNRFDSFAPVRHHVFAQWLVDGRDYMWNVSRAIEMARDVIYIHDWWLSPELYMRRPAAISQKWRLDRLLQRKAQEGVKIFVILYRNINSAIPIDSEYSKFSLLDLHPNVFVQRSPNQFRQNTFFWAHHEKICVVDHTIAFCGGIDLCFGRWDTPQHSVIDDKMTGFELNDMPKDADHCQLWPGKDYSNPRVQDFYALDKPYEEMYDRTKIPRMPWHDIAMQIVGQPARDLTRHFVQRWNYILRQRKPSRPTPFLLPPPDFNPGELEALGLDGTCEVQILRSTCWWSIGTPNKTEHSIMNAYVKMIETSEHFVYIENQFFVSSCVVDGTKIENLIGDALFNRIRRAYRDQEDWRAVIVIPLMPGFQNTVESADGSSVRLIMQSQYRSICRGDTSLFGRLRAEGVEPEDYIQFFALRSWGKIGTHNTLVTEQLYIHAKAMIVDDRIAIIGSANINERSMLGSRDSEVAAVIRDTDMISSYMGGEPYKVGRFPHTLRMRLMREHLGVDVDEVMEEERERDQWTADEDAMQSDQTSYPSSPTLDRETEQKLINSKYRAQDDLIARSEELHSFNHDADWEQRNSPHVQSKKKMTHDPRVTNNAEHERDVRGEGADHMLEIAEKLKKAPKRDPALSSGGSEQPQPELSAGHEPGGVDRRERPGLHTRHLSKASLEKEGYAGLPPPSFPRMDTAGLGLTYLSQLPPLPDMDDTDIGGPSLHQAAFCASSAALHHPLLADMRRPAVTQDCMRDPLNASFYYDTWLAVAENNTKLFRHVFRCMPDNEVRSWKEYKEFEAYAERFSQAQGAGKSKSRIQQETPGRTGPPGSGSAGLTGTISGKVDGIVEGLNEKIFEKLPTRSSASGDTASHSHGKIEQWAEAQTKRAADHTAASDEKAVLKGDDISGHSVIPGAVAEPNGVDELPKSQRERTVTYSEPSSMATAPSNFNGSQRRRRRTTTRSSQRPFQSMDYTLNKADAEELLNMVQGSLVIWPYDW